jgi:DNA-binding response OmpR family regulator
MVLLYGGRGYRPVTVTPGGNRRPATLGHDEQESRVRVLVVEDQAKLAMTIATVLGREGMAVDVAFDGQDALDHAAVTRYDVIVLDRDLPEVHGDDVCRALVADVSGSRVLMLTASGTVHDRVEGLGLGADDYLPKPFDFTELIARIRALARRSVTAVPPALAHADLRLDSAHRTVTRAGRPIALTPREFAVLEELLRARGAVVSTEQLLDQVWDEHVNPFTTTVKKTISRLRSKLGDPPLIETASEGGYRI